MKKLFLSFLTVLLPMAAFADAVEIDGICYNLNSEAKEAEVTSNPNYYSGRVDIPASIAYDGVEYSVTSIHSEAFSFCSALTSVSIPSSMTWIKYSAFIFCRNLTSVYISDIAAWCSIDFTNYASNPLAYGAELYLNGQVIKDLTIPDNVTKIGAYAFSGCSSLTSVTIPGGVTSIGGNTFDCCSSLTSVTIGSSVRYIYSKAFASCPELTDVFCLAENVPSTESDAFQDTHIEYATLHVPDSSIDAYKREEPWKNFKDIVSLDIQSIRNLQYASPADCIDIYSIDGKLIGSAADQSEAARIINNFPSGTSTIVKKGGKSVKVVVR